MNGSYFTFLKSQYLTQYLDCKESKRSFFSYVLKNWDGDSPIASKAHLKSCQFIPTKLDVKWMANPHFDLGF